MFPGTQTVCKFGTVMIGFTSSKMSRDFSWDGAPRTEAAMHDSVKTRLDNILQEQQRQELQGDTG